jgi:hypothetical protein
LHGFEEIADVMAGMQKLMDREPPLAAVLPRQPGTKEARYTHLLSGPAENLQFAAVETVSGHASSADDGSVQQRVESLEAAVDELRQQVAALSQKIDNLFG